MFGFPPACFGAGWLLAGAGSVLTERLDALVARRPGPFALLCAERDVAQCHRRLLAEHLVASGRYRLVAHL